MARQEDARLGIGPFRRVRQTDNPYDDDAGDMLAAMVNGYLEDPANGGSAVVRPGTTRFQSVSAARPQGFVRLRGGADTNFAFIGGKVYRVPTDLSGALVDVTPVGTLIATTGFVYAKQISGSSFVVNDGQHIPWVATDVGMTPITATPIPLFDATVNLTSGAGPDISTTQSILVAVGGTISAYDGSAGIALPAGTIPASQWGSYRVLLDPTNLFTPFTITAAAANYTTGYATEAAALSAVPAVTASRINVGYFTLQADAGGFIAGTDGIAGNTFDQNFYAGNPFGWLAYGPPTIYAGSVFFVLRTFPALNQPVQYTQSAYGPLSAYSAIVWSEPALPLEGYTQSGYDNLWDLIQTSTDPIFGLAATNDALYYFRQLSIGAVSGTPGINFQGTATHDIVGDNVGCVNPATIAQFSNYVYFTDVRGRPWRFAVGGSLEPIWQQAQSVVDAFTLTNAQTEWWSVVEPNLNVWLLAYGTTEPTAFLAFDALTGTYIGTWSIGGTSDGIQAGGVLTDSTGLPQLVVGNQQAGATYLWKLARVQDGVWTDNAVTLVASFTSGLLGYNAAKSYGFTRGRAVVRYPSGTPAATLALQTSQTTASASAGTVIASPVQSPNYRMTWVQGNLQGRGVQLTLTPTATASQFRVFRIEVDAVEGTLSQVDDF